MNKKNIILICCGILLIAIIPYNQIDTITYSGFAAFLSYIYFKEKSDKFAKEFEIWTKNNDNINNSKFNNELDKEYCQTYHQIFDPRLNKKAKLMLTEDFREILEKRKEKDLSEHCPEYEKLCIYPKIYIYKLNITIRSSTTREHASFNGFGQVITTRTYSTSARRAS